MSSPRNTETAAKHYSADVFNPTTQTEPIRQNESADIIPWNNRYKHVAPLYEKMKFSPELLDTLAGGLRLWASMLPYVDKDQSGRHKPANHWGIGAELDKIHIVEYQLALRDDPRPYEQLHTCTRELRQTALALDECYPKTSPDDDAAEQRLILAASISANTLADILEHLKKWIFSVSAVVGNHLSKPLLYIGNISPHKPDKKTSKKPTRKRSSRATDIEALRKELIEHIKSARDYAYTDIANNRPPTLLPRPLQKELGKRIGIPDYTVSLCFSDKSAHELRLLWNLANDLDAIMKYNP